MTLFNKLSDDIESKRQILGYCKYTYNFMMLRFLYIVAICILLYVVRSIATVISDQRKARALGCQPARWIKNRLPLGFDMFQRFKTAFDAGCFQEEMAVIFAEQGSRTIGLNMLGSNFYQTFEPKNIQALLATQFSDFALGDVRRQAFYPMLGNGIFTADGKAWYVCYLLHFLEITSANSRN